MSHRNWTAAQAAVLALAVIAGCGRGTGASSPQAVPAAAEKTFDFNACSTGKAPAGFTAALTGEGGPVTWCVQDDPAAPGRKVLAQTSADATSNRFPVCVYDGLSARDVKVSVRFKPISGGKDQSGGVIVRYQDKDNYYVARANALEDNVRFYKVVAGKRIEIGGMKTKVSPQQWHALALEARGNHFEITFDAEQFQAEDGAIAKAGLAGLWTKADSVTYFDNLIIQSRDAKAAR